MALPAILSGLGAIQSALDLFKKKKPMEMVQAALDTVSKFHGEARQDPEAAKVLADHELAMEQEYTKQATAALEVMEAEAISEDPFVRRARPFLMYVGYAVIFFQMVLFPLAKIRITDFVPPDVLYWFYTMFASGYLGYGVLRGIDKHAPTWLEGKKK